MVGGKLPMALTISINPPLLLPLCVGKWKPAKLREKLGRDNEEAGIGNWCFTVHLGEVRKRETVLYPKHSFISPHIMRMTSDYVELKYNYDLT